MEVSFELIKESGFLPLLTVISVLLLERYLPWPESYHPLTLFKLMATNLGHKVNPSKPRSPSQRKLSGTLAILVLLLPLLAIVAISIFIAQYPLFFNAFMLLIAIQYQPIVRHFKLVQRSIKQEKKTLARQHLSKIVLRDTSNLSPIGMGKAAIESLTLRFFYQQFSVILWFLVAGGIAALSVRLVFELQQVWNRKLPVHKDFGIPTSWLNRLVNLVPAWVFCFTFSLAHGFIGLINAYKNKPSKLATRFWLKLTIAGNLGIQLGGPAIYQGTKVREPKVGAKREVRYDDMQRTLVSINQTKAILIAMLLLILAALGLI